VRNNGILDITGGGSVSSGNVFIGRTNTNGAVTVYGQGSRLDTVAGLIKVGDQGIGSLRVQNGGMVSAPGGVSVNNVLSILFGDGTIVGNVTNSGSVVPANGVAGNSTGTLSINGDYSQGLSAGAGKLQIVLAAPTRFGKLDVTGNVALGGGTLEVSLTGGFVPSLGTQFDILDWGGSLIGKFTNVEIPKLGGLIDWDTSQLYTTGVISVIGPPPNLPGDFNVDGKVDAADYVVWRNGLGSTYTQDHYNAWRANFGRTAGSAAGATIDLPSSAHAAVPEPATWAVTFGALCLLTLARIGCRAGRGRLEFPWEAAARPLRAPTFGNVQRFPDGGAITAAGKCS
jgi:T5SS/PEP-CTERM-associated repeat protein